MSISKKILAFAAVSALTAATAVPAMALENEFHGMFKVRGIVSNFDDSNPGPVIPGNTPAVFANGNRNKPDTYSYIEQRARLMYIAKANDNLKLVTHFEIDSRWGDTSYNQNATNTTNNGSATRNNGGGIGADQVNLETKNVYLDFNIPSTSVNVKAGMQGFTDAYKGIIFNNDAAGVVATAKLSMGSVNFGYFRFDDALSGGSATLATNAYLNAAPTTTAATVLGTNAQVGNLTRDFATLGGKFNITKDLTVGADYYLLYSDVLKNVGAPKTNIHMLGVNANANVGPLNLSGFALYQTGRLGNGDTAGSVALTNASANLTRAQTVSALAANVAAKMKAGPGTAKLTALYVSGDKNTGAAGGARTDFQTIMERGGTTAGGNFFEANSQLLLRNAGVIANTDRAIAYDLNNNGKGTIAAFAGYDLALGKVFINSNIGIGAVANDNANTYGGSSNILGTEFNTEIGYKLYDNMTASVQAAYLVLGDYFKGINTANTTPDNPYCTKLILSYTF
jgi:hypothetical protein